MNKTIFLICLITASCFAMEKKWINTIGTFIKNAETKDYTIYTICNDQNQFVPKTRISTSGEFKCFKKRLLRSSGEEEANRLTKNIVIVGSPGLKRKLHNKAVSLTGTKESAELLMVNGFNAALIKEYIKARPLILAEDEFESLELLRQQTDLKEMWTRWRDQCIENPLLHNSYPENTSYDACFNPYIYNELINQSTMRRSQSGE